jgi:hypothetical protein
MSLDTIEVGLNLDQLNMGILECSRGKETRAGGGRWIVDGAFGSFPCLSFSSVHLLLLFYSWPTAMHAVEEPLKHQIPNKKNSIKVYPKKANKHIQNPDKTWYDCHMASKAQGFKSELLGALVCLLAAYLFWLNKLDAIQFNLVKSVKMFKKWKCIKSLDFVSGSSCLWDMEQNQE